MKKIKTHSFRLGTYPVSIDNCEGFCDTPDQYYNLRIQILDDDGYKGLSSALHESLHAEGIPDKYLHKGDGHSDTERIAKFLWRLGYRKTK